MKKLVAKVILILLVLGFLTATYIAFGLAALLVILGLFLFPIITVWCITFLYDPYP